MLKALFNRKNVYSWLVSLFLLMGLILVITRGTKFICHMVLHLDMPYRVEFYNQYESATDNKTDLEKALAVQEVWNAWMNGYVHYVPTDSIIMPPSIDNHGCILNGWTRWHDFLSLMRLLCGLIMILFLLALMLLLKRYSVFWLQTMMFVLVGLTLYTIACDITGCLLTVYSLGQYAMWLAVGVRLAEICVVAYAMWLLAKKEFEQQGNAFVKQLLLVALKAVLFVIFVGVFMMYLVKVVESRGRSLSDISGDYGKHLMFTHR